MSHRVVYFEGACCISQVKQCHSTLIEALHAEQVEVDLAAVETLDTTFVQLLVSASATASRRGKALRLTQVPDDVAASFRRAGFAISPETGCILGT